ncbi:DNA-directed RNA polymerase subunit F [Stygiolobus caldivivus]|uniref:DNA-directed RNA polymerase subunit F n=1 Tax=Stygiolobus caldivivus TaxID=2824673 RepID=UPI00215FD825|nr:DNA-directed RNA polymerase subunit F [Stygiolobus caldivivus]
MLEEHYIPYSVAKKYLQEIISNGNSSNLLQRTFDYLNSVSKCGDSGAEQIMEELKDIVKKEELRAMIASLCPQSIDEVRTILATDTSTTYTTEQVQKIIEIVKNHMES